MIVPRLSIILSSYNRRGSQWRKIRFFSNSTSSTTLSQPTAPATQSQLAPQSASAPSTFFGLIRAVLNAGKSAQKIKKESEASTTKPLDVATFRKLVQFAMPERRTLLAAVATLGLSSGISLIFPLALGQVLDVAVTSATGASTAVSSAAATAAATATAAGGSEGAAVIATRYSPTIIAGGLLGLFGIQSALIVVRSALLSVAGERMAAHMRKDLFKAIISQDMGWFDKHRTGDTMTRLSNDTALIQKALTSNIASGLRSGFMVIGGTGMLVYLSPSLALLSLSLIPPVAFAGMYYGQYVQGQQKAVQEAVGKTMEVTEELVGSVRTVRQFAREGQEAARFSTRVEESFQLARRIGVVAALFDGAVHAAANVAMIAVLWFGGEMVANGSMTAGDLTAFLMYSLYTGVNIASVSGVYTELKRAAGASERVFEVSDRLPALPLSSDAHYWSAADAAVSRPGTILASLLPFGQAAESTPKLSDRITGPSSKSASDFAVGNTQLLVPSLDSVQGEVVFKNVSFRYPTRLEVPVLDGFSLTVPSGKSLAIVGGSGSGKSTVGALLTRLYDPTLSPGDNSSGGAILLDGVDLRQLDPSWLRSSVVGVVSQEPVLFACSIADNIRYGRRIDSTAAGSAVSLDEVIEAAKMANAHTFISSFPNGYDTLVGERGVQLSGGQKQRVAIARAILKNPKVLILDEATSALDSESEAAVVEALAKLSKGRTTIMIAHRLSTIRSADLVALLSGGKIVEIGTFDELYGDDSSQFRKLVERQMRG